MSDSLFYQVKSFAEQVMENQTEQNKKVDYILKIDAQKDNSFDFTLYTSNRSKKLIEHTVTKDNVQIENSSFKYNVYCQSDNCVEISESNLGMKDQHHKMRISL